MKSPEAFRTIGEVSEALDVPQHVLRFWETKFPALRPLKRGGGRRYYRPEDVVLLRRIRGLLYAEGYTVRGVQKLLRERDPKAAAPPAGSPPAEEGKIALDAAARARAARVLGELAALRDMLRARPSG